MNSTVLNVVRSVCSDCDTPRSLAVYLMVKYGEWDQLVTLRVDPSNYLDARQYFANAIPTELLRKYVGLDTSFDKEERAKQAFFEAERLCTLTNLRLAPYDENAFTANSHPGVQHLIDAVRKEVRSILGAGPSFRFDGRFGPGGTFVDRGRLSTIPDKMSSSPTTTSWKVAIRYGFTHTAWYRAVAASPKGAHVDEVQGNRFTAVPKDSEKDRGICIEPSLNVFYQLALGEEIRFRLKSHGIDIIQSQLLHRRLARSASLTGELVTLDLSNASDTVSRDLVKILLPHRWWKALEELRSPKTLLGNKWIHLQKFSSMGNGYTFELETLLFYCIARACCVIEGIVPLPGVNVSAYGDDIIAPKEVAVTLKSALAVLGFTVNQKKSFTSGPFRESCGGDYFSGFDVRPLYIKDEPNGPLKIIALANGIQALRNKAQSLGFPPRFGRKAWESTISALPVALRRLCGPTDLGDSVLHTANSDNWQVRVRDSIRYYKGIVGYSPDSAYVSWRHFRPQVVLASALYGTGCGRRGVVPRDSDQGYRVKWIPFS